ncbi:MAG: endonuclease [Paludibacteraceae bacterium]|nr:endonuclease [Paludibacteraceae bacterium]
MKKHILFLAALCMSSLMMSAATVTSPADIPAYWASVDGKSGATLWSAVSAQTNAGYSSLGYSGLWTAYKTTDVYPADSTGKAGKIWDMYGECTFTYGSDQCGSYNGVCDCYNREHSIPKSWFGGSTSGIGCDIFHLVPTDGKINSTRSNDEFGEVAGAKNYYGNGTGAAGTWSTDRPTIASTAGEVIQGSGQVFEPKDQYKGDFARGYMGTIIKWQLANMTTANNFFSGQYNASGYFGFTKKAVVLMMKWHREDPVSQKEIDRNNGIQQTQGNRNPFIDYPYLAEYIWGEHAGETVDMDLLMPSTDPDFIPGVSDGARTFVPPIPGAMYGVTWSVNGEELYVDSIAEQVPIQVLPQTPTSCSNESNTFMGWTTAPIDGTLDDAPSPLYVHPADFPAVTADVTYYAVFAKETVTQGAAPATYTYDADHQEGWANTGANKGSYWLLDQGKTLVSPAIDLMGLESIVVKMRTFGGTQYDMLQISEESGVLTSIQATGGSTITEYTWNNNLYIAGTSTLTFACSNGAANKGIGIQSVVINATGSGSSYSRYITSCQSGAEVELVPCDEAAARKILVGGQIYILHNEQLFNIQGQRVK